MTDICSQVPYSFSPVAIVKSCYKAKFGIPRQPGLISEARGSIRLLPPYNQPNTVRGLEDFSHLWVLFVFHDSLRESWKATVRPPRLGGDTRVGVFASRSPFRPCPIGLSVLKLEKIVLGGHGKISLEVSGLDLLDGTPVLDIKPYLPYTDSIPEAKSGFAPQAPDGQALQLSLSPKAEEQFRLLAAAGRQDLVNLAQKVIASDPRPAYQRIPERNYSVFLDGFEIIWKSKNPPDQAEILEIRKASGNQEV
ncbi:MAG: tRNA (N6-threonylcarbamoyladenosine(37)-N6)-methyltransferase TrmO [Lentisphaeria bacterium]